MHVLRKWLDYGDAYLERSNWRDMALIKICLFALGVLVGTHIAPQHRKGVGVVALFVFVLSYIPLMRKFVDVVRENKA